jgi:hypothetical protein
MVTTFWSVFFYGTQWNPKVMRYDFVFNFVWFQLMRWFFSSVILLCMVLSFEMWHSILFGFNFEVRLKISIQFQLWGEIQFYMVLILKWLFFSVTLFYMFANVSFFLNVTLWKPKAMKSNFVWFCFNFSLFLGVFCMQLKGSHQQI